MSKYAIYSVIMQGIFCSFAFSHNSAAQAKALSAIDLNIGFYDVLLEEAFHKLEQKTEFDFAYLLDDLPQTKVTLSKKRRSVEEVLLSISKQSGVSFRRVNKTIHVRILDSNQALLQDIIQETRQDITVTGRVVSEEDGEGLPGANVIIKGTTTGTVTDIDGRYTLSVPSEESVLVFSSVGFISEEVTVGNRSVIDISLITDIQSLLEVVVIGYGTQKKEEVTAAISTVRSEDFVQTPTPDAAQLIRGKIAGLNVVTPDGNPLSTAQISLRGVTTLLSGAGPLVLIDGIPGSMNSVSPNDIAQIDVLKDGSAAAIYGTRGTNGVILITTKQNNGEIEPSIEFNSYISTQKIAKKLPIMSAAQYREKAAEGRPGAIDQGASVDWVDEILQTPVNQTYSVNIRGGSKSTSYIASFDYTSNEGIVKRSGVEVIYPRLSVVHRMFDDKLKIEGSVNGYIRQYGIPYNNGVYQNALIYNPTTPIKDENGVWSESARDMYENPLALLHETEGENKITNLRMYSAATFSPIDNLDIKYLISREIVNQFSGYYETKRHRSTTIQGRNGYASRSTQRTQYDMMELTLQYTKALNDDHNFGVLAGFTGIQNNLQTASMTNWNFPSDDYTYNNIGIGAALTDGSATMASYQSSDRLIGYFGRFNYNFRGKYYLSASIRHEGSSKFGKDHKWGNFPAVSVAWNLKNEQFLQSSKTISFLKLRAGFGITGTVPPNPYMSLNTLNFGGFGYYDGEWVNLLRPASNPNPDLRWEKKEEANIGLDFGFFNDRISGSLDIYRRNTKDLIYNYTVPVPPYLYSTIAANAGSIRIEGLEVSLNIVPVETENLVWNSNINFSTNKSILISLSNDKFVSRGFDDFGNTLAPIQQTTHRIEEGQRIGNFYGYKSIDIDESGHWIIEGEDGNPKPIAEQQATDKKIIGNGLPKVNLNWNHSIRYKQFDLGITMRGAFGFQILNMAEMNYAVPVNLGQGNIFEKAYDNVYGKRPLADDQELQYVSYYVEDGDYWKIDNVSIGYSPALKANKWIKRMRIYGSVSNLAVITGYKGIDPEVNVQGLTPGTDDRYRYPSVRTFTLGLNLYF